MALTLAPNLDADYTFEHKLPAELKAKWLEALRSGQYKQGTGGHLRTSTDEFCCLGVYAKACDLKMEIELGCWVYYYISPNATSSSSWLVGHPELQPEVTEVLKQRFTFIATDVERYLASMNDSGIPFSTIADWIEKHL